MTAVSVEQGRVGAFGTVTLQNDRLRAVIVPEPGDWPAATTMEAVTDLRVVPPRTAGARACVYVSNLPEAVGVGQSARLMPGEVVATTVSVTLQGIEGGR
jgi:hypothetical protein